MRCQALYHTLNFKNSSKMYPISVAISFCFTCHTTLFTDTARTQEVACNYNRVRESRWLIATHFGSSIPPVPNSKRRIVVVEKRQRYEKNSMPSRFKHDSIRACSKNARLCQLHRINYLEQCEDNYQFWAAAL